MNIREIQELEEEGKLFVLQRSPNGGLVIKDWKNDFRFTTPFGGGSELDKLLEELQEGDFLILRKGKVIQ